jgi:hypothetical protein
MHHVDLEIPQVLDRHQRVHDLGQGLAEALQRCLLVGLQELGTALARSGAHQDDRVPAGDQALDQRVHHRLDPTVAARGYREPWGCDDRDPKRRTAEILEHAGPPPLGAMPPTVGA